MSNEKIRFSINVDDIHENTSQEVISTTNDKLKLALIQHLTRVESSRAWHTPASLVLAISLVLCTSTFRDSFGVGSSVWQAFFMLLLLWCVCWLAHTLIKRQKGCSIDELIEVIKKKKSGGGE
ncbi:hypothetical protein [Pseudomonas syringae]|uniref:Uncharacterized protein n=3 Tax=Pseudomonas syringae TaxID=317 RepID=A0A9Q4A3X8_PSESX|nr:hypothetical protein [Pseudomonas syringae]MCF5470352.1 hypothetical protein [Pseudomonas syringae]MCF5471548.1 hypothetical protein [Pseudomonas syringae]MCF5482157.1 hypothetical protein [Pseudomonas syringae]MCF5489547.1 hypothetical protein [Pseudomonas syringae]MCF5495343.1 hypothetical protein [Pseudomonas syringae]